MRKDGRHGLRPGNVEPAQHANDSSDGIGAPCRMFGNLDANEVVRPGAQPLSPGNEYLARSRPSTSTQSNPLSLISPPGDFPNGPLQYLNHATLGAAMGGAYAGSYAIAAPKSAHFPGRKEDIRVTVVGRQETISVPVRLYRTDDKIQVMSQAELPCAIANKLPVPGPWP